MAFSCTDALENRTREAAERLRSVAARGEALGKFRGHIPEVKRRAGRAPAGPRGYSAVVGSIRVRTSDTLLAGKPPWRACSRTMASSGAMYTQ